MEDLHSIGQNLVLKYLTISDFSKNWKMAKFRSLIVKMFKENFSPAAPIGTAGATFQWNQEYWQKIFRTPLDHKSIVIIC